MDMELPGPDVGKGGKHVILPPAGTPDIQRKGILERATKAGRDPMPVPAFASIRPVWGTWKDQK
jgi:hypothetical protein